MVRTRLFFLSCILLLTVQLALGEKAISNKKGDACCGGEAYFQDQESCCNGKIIKGVFEDCCDGKGFNPGEGEICCRGDELTNNYRDEKDRKPKFEVLIKEKTIKGSDSLLMPLVCCGKGVIDTRIQVCCNAEAFDIRAKEGDMCCGGKLFDSKDGICCNGEFTKFKNKNQRDLLQCCGSKAFNPEEELCCSENIYKVPKDQPVDETRCCGDTGIFHVVTQTCCVEDHPQKGLVFATLLGLGECCGTKLFNPAISTCCRSGRGRAEVVTGANAQCCGTDRLDASSICCDDTVISNTFGDACCGAFPYHTINQTCCASKKNGEDKFQVLNGLGTCCGNRLIPTTTTDVTCCDEEMVQGTGTCCGKDLITNDNAQICCDNKVMDLLGDGRTACCGRTLYNPDFEVCCSESNQNVERGDSCCGDNGYYKDHQSCCDGKVVYGNSDKGIKCCGKNGYLPSKSTCCHDKADTVIHKLNVICCDGKELKDDEVCCRG